MPKGCLGKIIWFAVILFVCIAIITGILYGGFYFFNKEMQKQFNPTQRQIDSRVENFINKSSIPRGYSVEKAIDTMGIKAVITKCNENGQYMAIVDPGWVTTISQKDILDGTLEKKFRKYLSLSNNKNIQTSNSDEKQKCAINAFSQEIPCIEENFTVNTKDGSVYNIKLIAGVVKNTEKNNNNLVLSFNCSDKYDKTTAEHFFKNLKYKTDNTNKAK